MKTLFGHLEESLKDVDLSDLFNYDETNLTDDPACKTVLQQNFFFSFLSKLECGHLYYFG